MGGQLQVIIYLLKQGANIESRDKANLTPLNYAYYPHMYWDCVKYFLDNGIGKNIDGVSQAKTNQPCSIYLFVFFLSCDFTMLYLLIML